MHSETGETGKSQISPIRAIAIALLIFAVIKIFAIDILRVEEHSMEPTINPGRIIFVDRLAYGILLPFIDTYIVKWAEPGRNSLIVLKNPIDNAKLVKRCVALPGDRLTIELGMLVINSNESFRINAGSAPFFMTNGEAIVPQGKLLVLGDNLENSVDSRLFGFVASEKVTGSVLF